MAILSKNISEPLTSCDEVEFVWGKVTDTTTRHSVLILRIDNRPTVIIDFGDSNLIRDSSVGFSNYAQGVSQLVLPSLSRTIKGAINVFPFDYEAKIKILGCIVKFSIHNETYRSRVRKLIGDVLNIEMGDYHAKNNNCRHFVKKVFNLLKEEPECKEEDKRTFTKEMQDLVKEDQDKVSTGIQVVEISSILFFLCSAAVSVFKK